MGSPAHPHRFGTAGSGNLRGPGLVNLDSGLFRELKLGKRLRMQVRAEALDAPNTPHFANPGANRSNLQLNPGGSIRSLGGFAETTSVTGTGGEGIDERAIRFGLRLSFWL